MFNFYFSAKILAIKDIRIKKPGFFVFIFNKLALLSNPLKEDKKVNPKYIYKMPVGGYQFYRRGIFCVIISRQRLKTHPKDGDHPT
jgi:hypothetical protein